MPTTADFIARVRTEIGDLGASFLKSFDGGHDSYEVGVRNIDPATVQVRIVTNGVPAPIDPALFLLDTRTGLLTLVDPVPVGSRLAVSGTAYSMFADSEITRFVDTAARQHCHGQFLQTRFREEGTGFIKIRREKKTLANLPAIEIDCVAILATIEALWTMLTDASSDMDISTAEGTHLPRGQRWAQIMRTIDVLTDRYKQLCKQLNVGLYKIEQGTLRRVSYLTGRYVPVFAAREYDEHGLPIRQLPDRDIPDEDESGIPSPVWGGFGY
ncbi:hypothetical protein [Nonomuraea sp. SYSU D8015]|uniref:hypothetical protein n=1 Tax=Nonomuraea sp. SYSU D8015 TaxID=2593644 RepID=UPI00166056AF|nr:hypothetical protein [Nonomuraea sp. SYSU D8015]